MFSINLKRALYPFFLIFVISIPSLAIANTFNEKLASGKQCYVELNTKHPGCNGTLQRGVVYKVRYHADRGLWEVYGKICDRPDHQTVFYPGPYPGGQGYQKISMWGAMYSYTGNGLINHATFGDAVGTISCP